MLQDPGTFSRQGFLALIRICWQHSLLLLVRPAWESRANV